MLTKIKSNYNKILRILFGRTTLVILSIFLQIIVIYWGIRWLADYVFIAFWGLQTMTVVLLVILTNSDRSSEYKLLWMVMLILLPIAGIGLYIINAYQLGNKRLPKQLNEQNEFVSQFVCYEPVNIGCEAGFAQYMYKSAMATAYSSQTLSYYSCGEEGFYHMLNQLEKAEKFIFIEYFIIDRGYMWDTILEILKKKVQEGVEVRVMYDGMCSLSLLPLNYPAQLAKYGIKCKMFSPIYPVFAICQNNRDHRKMMIIDGKIAFTGGINLADEYINKIRKFGYWKDTVLEVAGEAVRGFVLMYLQLWNMDENYRDCYERYIPKRDIAYKGGGFVIPYGDTPYNTDRVGKQVYLNILSKACNYVHIMTPYLIPDEEIKNAIIYCARRGVEIVLLLPHIPDKKYVYYIARTFYAELLDAGVRIYEFLPGFVHSKMMLSDGIRAAVGSVNVDFRSFYLQYECGLYIYENAVIGQMEKDYRETIECSLMITEQNCREYSIIKKLMGRVLRIIAPLL